MTHIIRIPLCFHDILLDIDPLSLYEKKRSVSNQNMVMFQSTHNPIEYVL